MEKLNIVRGWMAKWICRDPGLSNELAAYCRQEGVDPWTLLEQIRERAGQNPLVAPLVRPDPKPVRVATPRGSWS